MLSQALRHVVAFTLLALALAGCGPTKLADGLPDGDRCSYCHGNQDNPAPPRSLVKGKTSADVEVGQHQLHLRGGFAKKHVPCESCHVVPVNVEDEGHIDHASAAHPSDPADVTFGGLATLQNLSPAWSRGPAQCSNTYCHGTTLHGGKRTTPTWTFDQEPDYLVQFGTETCSGCHGAPPPPPHPARTDCEKCHPTSVGPGLDIVVDGTHLDGKLDVSTACNSCHGNAVNPGPPTDTQGNTSTLARGVGAHQQHLTDTSIRKAVDCAECHVVPKALGDVGHVDSALPAELTFGPLATGGVVTPSFNGTSCSSTYCHGATLHGGDAKAPTWTTVDGTQAQCGSCHGAPPPAPHPPSTRCATCHPLTVFPDGGIDVAGGYHIDGKLQVGEACNTCHGGPLNPAPPFDTTGHTNTTERGVGAHQQHLSDSPVRNALPCESCHLVPKAPGDVGHYDSALPAELTFSGLATADGGLSPTFDGTSCGSTYCHGATLHGGAATTPDWLRVDGTQAQCGSCHGAPPPAPHPASTACATCHPMTVFPDGGIDLDGGRHINGTLDLNTACNTCHGGTLNPAPPFDTTGHVATTERGVGAHQAHLSDSAIRQALPCESCHVVPQAPGDVGHYDTPLPAELTFSGLATADGGLSPTFDGTTCSNSYCHGATLHGGAITAPDWLRVDAGQAQCDSCHGFPPPAPHPPSTACATCHPLTALFDGGIDVAGGYHVNGTLDVNVTCNSCHGGPVNPAPPKSTLGLVATTEPGVGAHQSHLGPSTWHKEVLCDACHLVPATVNAPGHLDSALPAELTWGPLARAKTAQPTYDGAAHTCASVYCHGAATRGGSLKQPAWTQVDAGQAECGTCHGVPPPNHYGSACHLCHPTMDATEHISDPARHIDGKVDVNGGGACGACHPVPPQTGAHVAHYGQTAATPVATYGDTRLLVEYVDGGSPGALFDGGQPTYMFGCGNCHPLDPALHLNGSVDIELYDAGAQPGSLKLRNSPTAAYDRTSGTCSGVYCHSSGQETPTYAASPGWTSGVRAACDTCHGNPPNYPSGGAGTATANVHLVMADDGYEFGHFAGNPGPWHSAFHGGGYGPAYGAGAITCQTCHFDTTNPVDTGPSGFYWLNTTGTYTLDGGGLGYACANCHAGDAGVAPLARGGVLPLKHVNGVRDVAFDRRDTLPLGYDGGVAVRPTAPFWVLASSGMKNYSLAQPDGLYDGGVDAGLAVEYLPATKTCTNIACHRAQKAVQWGITPVGWDTCNNCHQY